MKEQDYRERLDEWIDAHQEEMISDLETLVRIPSVKGEASESMPYGKECARVLSAMREMMDRYGLDTKNYGNRCVTGDLVGKDEKTLDILSHLDVVPVSDSWTVTKPFVPMVKGDRIYGRGTCDDKGPAICALYALRAVKELEIPLKNGVRLIYGSDEECGSSDLEYYYGIEKEAKYTFSPDADFPLINIEKGRLQKSFWTCGGQAMPVLIDEGDNLACYNKGVPSDKSSPLLAESEKTGQCINASHPNADKVEQKEVQVLSMRFGDKANVIPGEGVVVLTKMSEKALKDAVHASSAQTKASFTWNISQDEVILHVHGRTGHAAYPEGALNAITAALQFLRQLPLVDSDGERRLLSLSKMFPHGDFHGSALGINYSDEESGDLTITLDILDYKTSEDRKSYCLKGVFDCRSPMCANDINLTQKLRTEFADAGMSMEEGGMTPVHFVSADSELVKKLLESYELYFGVKGKPLAIGGGTYVHDLERGVAFGCQVEGVDNHMHGDDEFMVIPIMAISSKIFANSILRLCM